MGEGSRTSRRNSGEYTRSNIPSVSVRARRTVALRCASTSVPNSVSLTTASVSADISACTSSSSPSLQRSAARSADRTIDAAYVAIRSWWNIGWISRR